MRRGCRRRAGSEDVAAARLAGHRPLDLVQEQFTAATATASGSRSGSASGHEEPPQGAEEGEAATAPRRSSMALCSSRRRRTSVGRPRREIPKAHWSFAGILRRLELELLRSEEAAGMANQGLP
jgi:hypothetical protein